jgi:hypothetical protein
MMSVNIVCLSGCKVEEKCKGKHSTDEGEHSTDESKHSTDEGKRSTDKV